LSAQIAAQRLLFGGCLLPAVMPCALGLQSPYLWDSQFVQKTAIDKVVLRKPTGRRGNLLGQIQP
jgi:hypothetical protein